MEFSPEKGLPAADAKPVAAETFAVDDLLDFSNDDGTFDTPALSDDSSPAAGPVDSCNSSSFSGVAAAADAPHRSFSSDLCVPCDEVAELKWLSNFVEEESFSTEDLQKLHLISGLSTSSSSGPDKARPESNRQLLDEYRMTTGNGPAFSPESLSVPAKARSKRSRAAPCSWASRLQVLSPPDQMTALPEPELSACSDLMVGPDPRMKPGKKKGGREGPTIIGPNGEVRRCLHCATDKTPQWRTGPMGPKTLCNACGVRYKSGRLVPEYRPASSPTFVQTKHSNSHRKVMELRRQKEVVVKQQVNGDFHELRQQVQSQPQFIHGGMVFDMPNANEYLIHQHIGPDFRQLI